MGKVDKRWLHDHLNDPYVKLAQQRAYRSRAAFKLIGIDDQDRLIRPGMTVVDLGSAPGSWTQVLVERLGRRKPSGEIDGKVIALDLLEMEPVAGVDFLVGDFREEEALAALETALDGQKVDLVVSDMAPNLSGVAVADSARMQDLALQDLDAVRAVVSEAGLDVLVTIIQSYPISPGSLWVRGVAVTSIDHGATPDVSIEQQSQTLSDCYQADGTTAVCRLTFRAWKGTGRVRVQDFSDPDQPRSNPWLIR